MIVWKVRVEAVGILVWGSLREGWIDMRDWQKHGHWSYLWPSVMSKSKFETLKEFTGP